MPLPLDLPDRPEERVLRQLVAALLYEGILAPTTSGAPGDRRFEWRLAGRRFRCRGAAGPFGRLRIAPGSIEMSAGRGGWSQAALGTLVESLPAEAGSKAGLLDELGSTLAFCRWNAAHLPRRPRRALGFSALEGALDEGHPYHPSFKARTGFSKADHAAYGPEAASAFRLVWLAVDRRRLDQNLPQGEAAFWISELGEAAFAELAARRATAVSDSEAFGLLPLHPWQWAALKDGRLAPWLADDTAHVLGEAGDRYRASQSVRTLMNADRPERANVKLAMDMVNTSSRRTIEPRSVCAAPVVSRWLGRVVAGDPLFEARYPLAILPEYAGIIAGREGPLAGQLAAIWRRSAESVLGAGEAAVPFNALMTVEADGRSFVDDWIGRFGLSAWIDRLIEVAVVPVWHLLVRHGMATEAHGQNMVLVHRDGWPVRLILRDFHDSLEYVPDFLGDPAGMPDFPALDPAYREAALNEFYWMERVTDLRDLVVDTLFVYNLTEVSHLLAIAHGFPEPVFWKRIADRLARYSQEHGLEARQARLGHAEPNFRTESLLSRKLWSPVLHGAAPDLSHPVENPFASAGGRAAARGIPILEGAQR